MKKSSFLILFILLIVIFHSIFSFRGISGGDWPFFFPEQLQTLPLIPALWNAGLGLGHATVSPWIDSYLGVSVAVFVRTLRLPWEVSQVVSFFLPALVFSSFTPILLYKALIKRLSIIPGLVFTLNTYFLMIYTGGQMGIVLAYSVAPLVFLIFIRLQERLSEQKYSFTHTILFSLAFALQFLFDIRIAYVTLVGCGLYWLYRLFVEGLFQKPRLLLKSFFFLFFLPGILVFFLHAYWLLPNVLFKVNPVEQLGPGYSSLASVRFFSFAYLENTISLLHPNWPENIFGKVSFMRPEFLLIPILAFLSFLFINRTKQDNERIVDNKILFFIFLGLLGVFLAKGTNEPLGQVYIFLFERFPGFFMFRDATKWYTLITLSYSILMPFSILSIYDWLSAKCKVKSEKSQFKIQNYLPHSFLLLVIIYLLFLVRPAIFNELSGIFRRNTVPNEYYQLKDFLVSQSEFSRTLWIPQRQRFGYYSANHPAIHGQTFFQVASPSGIVTQLKKPDVKKLLQEAAVWYVIVPYDSLGELFQDDRKYDAKQYVASINGLEEIPWLTRVENQDFGKIAVFSLQGAKDHFWLDAPLAQKIHVIVVSKNKNEYILSLKGIRDGERLVFSEQFSPHWIANVDGRELPSERYHKYFNSFILPSGEYKAKIQYAPDRVSAVAFILSVSTLFALIFLLYMSKNTQN